jgi:hypothetical protein
LIEQVLKLVISEGFLYRYDCRSLGATCRRWWGVWQETQDVLPDWASLQVLKLTNLSRGCDPYPAWVTDADLLTSHAFLRKVFDEIRALKVAAKPSKKKRAQAQAELPKFEDYEMASVSVWESRSPGQPAGMHIRFSMKKTLNENLGFLFGQKGDFICRLHPDFSVMTGIRCWRVYDGEPLWP